MISATVGVIGRSLGRKNVGDQVNLEVDVLAKYVERLLGHGQGAVAAAAKEES